MALPGGFPAVPGADPVFRGHATDHERVLEGGGGFQDRVVVSYNDAPDPESRSPAVLESPIGRAGV